MLLLLCWKKDDYIAAYQVIDETLSIPKFDSLGEDEVEAVLRQIASAAERSPDSAARFVESKMGDLRKEFAHSAEDLFRLSILCDLVLQGWTPRFVNGGLTLTMQSATNASVTDQKARVRASHTLGRNQQVSRPQVRNFVAGLEAARLYKGKWVSIFSLMRDGKELSQALRIASASGRSVDAFRSVIDPYLQVVDSHICCEFTGLKLTDIWRYFRYTWSSSYDTVPGRRMHVLVRDAAAPFHPIIGIAALSSPVIQSKVRDAWIGWTGAKLIAFLKEQDDSAAQAFLGRSLTAAARHLR
jgi:hypothetical protein